MKKRERRKILRRRRICLRLCRKVVVLRPIQHLDLIKTVVVLSPDWQPKMPSYARMPFLKVKFGYVTEEKGVSASDSFFESQKSKN